MPNSREKIAKRKGLSWHRIISFQKTEILEWLFGLIIALHRDMIRERLPFMGALSFLFKMSSDMRPRKEWRLINLYIENFIYFKEFEESGLSEREKCRE